MRPIVIGKITAFVVAGAIALSIDANQARAQDLPTDTQIQAAFGVSYNHLGLMQYCAARKFATAADVANSRKVVEATVAGMNVSPAARAQQEVGQHGTIIGKQIIGLMDPRNPAHPEMVPEGQTMSLADNAKAQHTSERALCRQMAAQAAPLR